MKVTSSIVLSMLLLVTVLLKPLHEFTVHHCEEKNTSSNQTELVQKTVHCPICDLQVSFFDNSFFLFSFRNNSNEIKKQIIDFPADNYVEIIIQKKGRGPPQTVGYST